MRENHYRLIIEQEHKLITLTRRRIMRALKKRNKRMNKGRKKVELEIVDHLFYKIHLREEKLDQVWQPYYRIADVSSIICNLGSSDGGGELRGHMLMISN